MKEHQIEISADASSYIQSLLGGGGGYENASDYVESLIREDQLSRAQHDLLVADNREELERLAIEGLQSGEATTVDADFWAKKRHRLTDEFGGQAK